MPVIVHGVHMSPPVRSVLLTAKAIGLEVQLKYVDMKNNENKSEAFLKLNPAHTIPVIDDDGFILFESRAIMAYLVEKYGNDDKLYPKDIKKRALINNMMYFDSSALFPSAFAYIVPQLFLGTPPDPEKEAILTEKLGIVNTILGQRPYFAGDEISIADFGLINSLTFPVAACNFSLDAYPNIVKWMAKIQDEIPFYDEVTKKGLDALRAFPHTKVFV